MVNCVYRQGFLEVLLGPFSNVNDRIMPMSDAVSSEGIQQRFSACPLRTEISPVSLNLLMLLIFYALWMMRFAKPLQIH